MKRQTGRRKILMKPFEHLDLTVFEVRLILDLLKLLFFVKPVWFQFLLFSTGKS